MAWANAAAFNFRETDGGLGDVSPAVFVAPADTFPKNYTCGAETVEAGYVSGDTPSNGGRNRVSASEVRFQGFHMEANGGTEMVWRVTLDEAGEHVFTFAGGDHDYSTEAHAHSFREGTTAWLTFSTVTVRDAGKYWDTGAGGENQQTDENFLANDNVDTHTLASTDFRMYGGRTAGGGGFTEFSHLHITPAAGGAPAATPRLMLMGVG